MIFGGDSRGRPKKIDGKTKRFNLRMTLEEDEKLGWMCEKTGLNKTEVIRKALGMYENLLKYRR